jgi:hypothetical protein
LSDVDHFVDAETDRVRASNVVLDLESRSSFYNCIWLDFRLVCIVLGRPIMYVYGPATARHAFIYMMYSNKCTLIMHKEAYHATIVPTQINLCESRYINAIIGKCRRSCTNPLNFEITGDILRVECLTWSTSLTVVRRRNHTCTAPEMSLHM